MKLRLGHAVYGSDGETIALASAKMASGGIIIESNPESNIALSHISHRAELAAITRYATNGIPVVIGSDGPGMYSTGGKSLAIYFSDLPQAVHASLRENIHATEARVLSEQSTRFSEVSAEFVASHTPRMEPTAPLIDTLRRRVAEGTTTSQSQVEEEKAAIAAQDQANIASLVALATANRRLYDFYSYFSKMVNDRSEVAPGQPKSNFPCIFFGGSMMNTDMIALYSASGSSKMHLCTGVEAFKPSAITKTEDRPLSGSSVSKRATTNVASLSHSAANIY